MKPIEEMTGLELREAVAVEVMGYIKGERKRGEPEWLDPNMPVNRTVSSLYRGMMPLRGSLPAYESSIEAAFALVEKMREKGWRMILDNCGGAWECEMFLDSPSDARVFGIDDTAPLAIARASLKAVRAK